MKADTTIVDFAGSTYVRIPKDLAKYFKADPGVCSIEDTNKNEAKLVFR